VSEDTAAALAKVLAEHDCETPRGYAWVVCDCGEEFHEEYQARAHVASALAAVERIVAAHEAAALREAAEWVAESLGYPIQVSMPEHPMPESLWSALVDHVHADKDGKWHGNELNRSEVEGWLADEAGRIEGAR
jgi:hypothetical protein